MCRLLAFTAIERKNFYEVVGDNFDDFIALSAEHKDGWGIAHDGKIEKNLKSAGVSHEFSDTVKRLNTNGALLHLRLASKGIAVDIRNNHPFIHGKFAFMHNGTIRPANSAEQFISDKYKAFITGSTDSELLFYAVLTQIDELGLIEGVKKCIILIRENADCSALNIIIQTPEHLIAVCEFKEGNKSKSSAPDHYELRFAKTEHEVVVASTGWGIADWQHLENHQILVVDRATLEFSLSSL